MEDLLIWVDENDREIGFGEKIDTHIREQLHRAFSLFIIDPDKNEMLIHRRASGKYHSGGLWTNACCSHPRKGEELKESVIRRAKEELGLIMTNDQMNHLQELGKFHYLERYIDCAEHEIDHVFYLPVCKDQLQLNPDSEEIAQMKWMNIAEVKEWYYKEPKNFSAWFKKGFDMVERYIK